MNLTIIKRSSSKYIIILVSKLLAAISTIIFIPIFVKLIGAESYGLIAFYGTLVGSLSVLDLGLSLTISRQIAILKTDVSKLKEITNLVFSVEIIYWLIALTAGIIIIYLSSYLAIHWVRADKLPISEIKKAVIFMGIIFAFQFPTSIYDGVMIGLEKQSFNAAINTIFVLIKNVTAVLMLKFYEASIETYFATQLFFTVISILTLLTVVKLNIRVKKSFPKFSIAALKNIWRFAAGVTGISIVTFFLTQIDKIVVSKLVLLEYVGYYSIAFTVSAGLIQIISPIQPIVFPKFVTYVSENKEIELLDLYHKSCKWISIIIFPICFIIMFFAHDILYLWTNNLKLTTNTAPILQICIAGTALNCLMWMPYYYMLAKGITKFTIYQNLIAAVILVPLLFFWTDKYGIIGASFVWLLVNLGYVIISLPIFHKLYLRGQLLNWYKNDLLVPVIISLLLATIIKTLQAYYLFNMNYINFILLITLFTICYVFILPDTRRIIAQKIFK